METPAEYFTRVKANQQQALKMLGHPSLAVLYGGPHRASFSAMEPATSTTTQSALMASVAVGAIFGIITAAASPSGWLWTLLWAIDGAVFLFALIVWVIGRLHPH
jgi:hypothetical protein